MRVNASAPGKLVLLGEYAVLHGAPALVMALDRRAEVALSPVAGPDYQLDSHSGESSSAKFRISAKGALNWQSQASDPARRFALVSEVLEALCADGVLDPASLTPFRATLSTSGFFERSPGGGADKLGLGSSAALTTAWASALAHYVGCGPVVAERPQWLRRLYALHRKFQRGQGSGLDIAASIYGGLIRYQLTGAPVTPTVAPLRLPRDLHPLFVWSGRSASTRELLECVGAWRDNTPDALVLMSELGEVAAAGAGAAEAGDAATLMAAAQRYVELLGRLGEASGADIISAEHRAIARLAHAAGAVYKPCGAGGGDAGVALTSEPERAHYLRRSLHDAGYKVLALRIDSRGLITRTTTE